MSIIYCEKHSLHWDSDFKEECDLCQLNESHIQEQEKCSVCGDYYPYPVGLHHTERECSIATQPAAPVAWMCQLLADSSKVYFLTKHPDLHDDSPWDRIIPLYTTPQPGVRDGMLRAVEICKMWESKLSHGSGYAIRIVRDAIARAAEELKVNAEGVSHGHS